jgi:hypothetical protein
MTAWIIIIIIKAKIHCWMAITGFITFPPEVFLLPLLHTFYGEAKEKMCFNTRVNAEIKIKSHKVT